MILTMIKKRLTISTMMRNSRRTMKLIMMNTMMRVTMQNRSLIILKMELIIDRPPLQSTGKSIPSKIAILRKNLLRNHTKNMKLRQRPHTNQIDTLSQGVILETQTEDLMEDMDQVLFSSQKSKYFLLTIILEISSLNMFQSNKLTII
jgi:hypothetical protein